MKEKVRRIVNCLEFLMTLYEKKHLGAILRDICNKCHVTKRGSHKLNTRSPLPCKCY